MYPNKKLAVIFLSLKLSAWSKQTVKAIAQIATYAFNLLSLALISRLVQAKSATTGASPDELGDGIFAITVELPPRITPSQEIYGLIALCLKLKPISDQSVYRLRDVTLVDRKNLYRRASDAIEVLQDIQLLLLALAYEDKEYEEFFSLDLQIKD